MSFAPLVPFGGVTGWAFLKRTVTTQKAVLAQSPEIKRDEAYFREKIGSIKTAEALVADRRLLGVALGAYGLDADIGNKAFIKKILADGTLNPDALGNKLADKQYLALSDAFGFGDFSTPNTQLSTFADKTIAAYRDRQFEARVGDQNDDLRLGLNAERELTKLAGRRISEDAKWFTVLGSAPLRKVFEKALGLPSSFASIDLDQQLTAMKDKASRAFGSDKIDDLAQPEALEKLVRRFLIRSEVAASTSSAGPGATALSMLQTANANGVFRPRF